MQKKQVAVIDFGSSEIRAIVGEAGVNKTFIIKGQGIFPYDGYSEGLFFDEEGVKRTLSSVIDLIDNVSLKKLSTVYVGVPGAFTEVTVKDSQLSFPKKKKITSDDIDSLFDAAFVMSSLKRTLINRSAVVYELDDFKKVANPVGEVSETLKGKLSFIECDNYFIELIKSVLKNYFYNIEFVSSDLAEALFLVEPESRDRIVMLCDIGYIATTLMIIQGDGIVYKKSFGYGGGYISAELTRKLDISFEEAEALKKKINLAKVLSDSAFEVVSSDNGQYYDLGELKRITFKSLDNLCESISSAIENSGYSIPEYVPLLITGGGISFLRGAKEHVSDRLNMQVKIVSPKIPLMENPTKSSWLSLLNFGYEQQKS